MARETQGIWDSGGGILWQGLYMLGKWWNNHGKDHVFWCVLCFCWACPGFFLALKKKMVYISCYPGPQMSCGTRLIFFRSDLGWEGWSMIQYLWHGLKPLIPAELLVESMFQGELSCEARWTWPHVEPFFSYEGWTSGKWLSYEGAWKVGILLGFWRVTCVEMIVSWRILIWLIPSSGHFLWDVYSILLDKPTYFSCWQGYTLRMNWKPRGGMLLKMTEVCWSKTCELSMSFHLWYSWCSILPQNSNSGHAQVVVSSMDNPWVE